MHGAGGTHDAVRGASADGRMTVASTADLPPAPAASEFVRGARRPARAMDADTRRGTT